MLAGVEVFRSHLCCSNGKAAALSSRRGPQHRGSDALSASHRIEFTELAYNASLGDNPEFDATFVRFQYESFVTRSVFDYDVRTRERRAS